MITAWRRFTILFVASALVLLFTAFYPYRQLQQARAELVRARVELEEKEQLREQMEQRRERLLSPVEVERLARERFGMARPDEIPFVVVWEGHPGR